MRSDLFNKKLNWFKQHEQPEAPLLISSSPSKTRILIAWPHIEIFSVKNPPRLTSDDEFDIWFWLWEHVGYDIENIRSIAHAGTDYKYEFWLLKSNRLIYPDGTIHSGARAFLNREVRNMMDGKQRPARTRRRGRIA